MSCACGKDTCGCETPIIIHLADESGQPHAFYLSERLSVTTGEYAFLISLDDADQCALLKIQHDEDGREFLINIEDAEEWASIEQVITAP